MVIVRPPEPYPSRLKQFLLYLEESTSKATSTVTASDRSDSPPVSCSMAMVLYNPIIATAKTFAITSSPASRNSFMTVPLEARRMFYKLALPSNRQVKITRLSREKKRTGNVTSLLRLNKQVYSEACDLLYSRNTFIFGNTPPYREYEDANFVGFEMFFNRAFSSIPTAAIKSIKLNLYLLRPLWQQSAHEVKQYFVEAFMERLSYFGPLVRSTASTMQTHEFFPEIPIILRMVQQIIMHLKALENVELEWHSTIHPDEGIFRLPERHYNMVFGPNPTLTSVNFIASMDVIKAMLQKKGLKELRMTKAVANVLKPALDTLLEEQPSAKKILKIYTELCLEHKKALEDHAFPARKDDCTWA
ncbi:hypothetical protein G7Y89_g13946 [Cudoniella acicularis]|uniref:Uncharacterized protein n=1 Tax=Cudoniella acicularis TaxID=354080 RepID=A0A8H4R6I1_9HELO|nr:hypothetical protein G7Y89_g13946 [Cudoniella acicularis]